MGSSGLGALYTELVWGWEALQQGGESSEPRPSTLSRLDPVSSRLAAETSWLFTFDSRVTSWFDWCCCVWPEVGTPMRMTQILCLFVIIPLVVRRFGERRALYIACAGRAVGYGVFQGLSALPLLPLRAQQVL